VAVGRLLEVHQILSVKNCLSRLSLIWRSLTIKDAINKFKLKGGKGFHIFVAPTYLDGELAPERAAMERYIAKLVEWGLWRPPKNILELIRESYELGGHKILYPLIYIILEGPPCRHWRTGGCTMCGYNLTDVSTEIRRGWKNFTKSPYRKIVDEKGATLININTRGSFFDDDEIDEETRRSILTYFIKRNKYIHVESRADVLNEYLDSRDIDFDSEYVSVGVGLESASQEVLDCSVNKNMTVEDVVKAVKRSPFYTILYAFTPKPFLSFEENVYDIELTLRFARELSTPIMLFPLSIHKTSLVELMFKNGIIRPYNLREIATLLYSLPEELLDVVQYLQHFPCIGEPYSPSCEVEEDVKNISRWIITRDITFLEELDPLRIRKERWSEGEICGRAWEFCKGFKTMLFNERG